jgi:ABC-type branched-subunit amino acid transport system substrate-binding protein
MEHLTRYLVDTKGMKRIACFYQNDGYGLAGLNGIILALKRRGMKLVSTGHYKRNTVAVKSGLLKIRKGKPQAVVMVGAYKPCAEFIKLAHRVKMKAVFVNISFVGSNALAKELGKDGEGVVVTQVVPFPADTSLPLVAQYHAALKAADPKADPGFVSLEGYMVGKLVIQALEKTGDLVTRAGLLAAIREVGTFDLGGVTLSYGPNDSQGMDKVFLTVIQADGSYKAVDRLEK